MDGESDKIRDSLVDQLASFDDKIDDIEMLADIQEGIGRLLGADGGNEAQIRRVLQDRYDNGALRKETFQLVKSLLDKYVTERASTTPPLQRTVKITPPGETTPPLQQTVKITPPHQTTPHLQQTVKLTPGDPAPTVTGQDANAAPATGPATDSMRSTVSIPQAEPPPADAAEGNVQVGSVLRDRFLLQERVSGGSMGVVYKALDRRLAEAGDDSPWVAIKVLSPQLSRNGQALRALQQEAAKGRCLVHPNIVRFVDLDRDDELYFIVMEWLEGRTLADILDSPDSGSIDTERAFKIVRQVGKALDYAHRCGIVHADVKPGNIMIAPNGDAKLFDFGIARVRQAQVEKDPGFDPAALGLMTPAYSSMQVLTGEKPVPADDVFSLACLLYRLIAGYRVFGPRNAAEAAEEGMEPQRIDKLSDANWRVLKKALSYPRVTRFESTADFVDALDAGVTEAITVDIPAPTRFSESEEKSHAGRVVVGLFVVAALLGVAGNQLGWFDTFKERYLPQQVPPVVVEPEPVVEEALPEAESAPVAEESTPVLEQAPAADEIADESVVESIADEKLLEAIEPVEIPEPEVVAAPLVDFTKLPPPTAEIRIGAGSSAQPVTVRLRENGAPATVDLVRSDVEFPLTLRIDEAGYSGNRSPWAAGQYEFSNDGYLDFPVGQDRARVTLTMMPDPLREADQQSTLRVRKSDSSADSLAIINVVLEDDDQRAFEATLAADTVAFATSQVSVNEQDPAVQLDIIRFNPGNTSLVVAYTLRDITATLGEDYFAPGGYTIEFGPGQRSTRLLIPLVQDSEYENNEAFAVELSNADTISRNDVFTRVAVMIRDDDQ